MCPAEVCCRNNAGTASATDNELLQACSNKIVDEVKSNLKAVCEQAYSPVNPSQK